MSDYTTFRAEFVVEAGDIIFHFYKTPEVHAKPDAFGYWSETFPQVLEPTALKFFGVSSESGRLKAQHIYDEENPYTRQEPLDSWWFRAYGFGHRLDPHALARRFLEAFDSALDASLAAK